VLDAHIVVDDGLFKEFTGGHHLLPLLLDACQCLVASGRALSCCYGCSGAGLGIHHHTDAMHREAPPWPRCLSQSIVGGELRATIRAPTRSASGERAHHRGRHHLVTLSPFLSSAVGRNENKARVWCGARPAVGFVSLISSGSHRIKIYG
jgi:hypothetical protein